MKKILVVEDEIAISMVLKAYLQREGFEVNQVYDGAEVMNVFDEVKPDLVLLDVMLPGKDGWSILNEIREQSTCPVHHANGINGYRLPVNRFKIWSR